MLLFKSDKTKMVSPEDALPGRDKPSFAIPSRHEVLGTPIQPPFPEGIETAVFALGCFWGAERLFWQLPGVYSTASGDRAALPRIRPMKRSAPGKRAMPKSSCVPTIREKVSYEELLKVFFEAHDTNPGHAPAERASARNTAPDLRVARRARSRSALRTNTRTR